MKGELLHDIVVQSFERPALVPKLVDDKITRNRSLHSRERRELSDLLFDLLRWRRRIFGDIAPSRIDIDHLTSKLNEAKALRSNPPLARWSHLSVDELSREVSFPTWLIDTWVHTYGFASAVSLALAFNEPAPTTIRVNTLKSTREKLKKALEKEDVPTEEGKHSPWALHLKARENVRGIKAFQDGLFEVQEEGSQLAIEAFGALPGETVVDACAGAGGKTLAIAARMENSGKIYSLDADSRILPELKKRAKRAGVKITETHWVAADDPHPLPDLVGKADRVLVDAPCSSLGTLRRKPWLKWESTKVACEAMGRKQLSILTRFSNLLRPGGTLLYVTCTIDPAENEKVVEAFLKEKGSFRAEEAPRLLRPDVEGTDAFFIAKIRSS